MKIWKFIKNKDEEKETSQEQFQDENPKSLEEQHTTDSRKNTETKEESEKNPNSLEQEKSLKQQPEEQSQQQSSNTTNQTQTEQETSTESEEDESQLSKEADDTQESTTSTEGISTNDIQDNNPNEVQISIMIQSISQDYDLEDTSLRGKQSPSGGQENDEQQALQLQIQSSSKQKENQDLQKIESFQEQQDESNISPTDESSTQIQITSEQSQKSKQTEQETSTESREDESKDTRERPKEKTSLTEDQTPSNQKNDESKETLKQIESKSDQEKNTENQTENQSQEEDLNNDAINQNEIEKIENQNTKEQTEKTQKSKENNNNRQENFDKNEDNNQQKNNYDTNTKEKLQNYRDILSKIQKEQEKEQKQEDEEESEEINETNEFLESLKDLSSFKDRDRGDGYSIDTHYSGSIPDSVIRMIINKFLNQRFLKKDSTLNSRTKSLEKTYGFYKLNTKDFIKHLETEQLTKIPLDKYDYKEESGRSETIPFSFYFDLSGSMREYTGLLSVLAIELLKKDVKVLIGFNEKVNVQIDKIKGIDTIEDLKKLLTKFGEEYYGYNMTKDKLIKESGVYYRIIRENIDNYLIRKRAEKCVIYSDFDPANEICNLSLYSQIYWFCFEEEFTRDDLEEKYNGFLYKVQNLNDIVNGILVINERKFKNLIYIDDPNILKKKIR